MLVLSIAASLFPCRSGLPGNGGLQSSEEHWGIRACGKHQAEVGRGSRGDLGVELPEGLLCHPLRHPFL